MKNQVSIIKQNLYSKIINGIAWCLFGIANLFDNFPCLILRIVFMVVVCISTGMFFAGNREEDDEMSISHKYRAESSAYHFIMVSVCIIGTISIGDKNIMINVNQLYPFLLGVGEIVVGFMFMHFEKAGD